MNWESFGAGALSMAALIGLLVYARIEILDSRKQKAEREKNHARVFPFTLPSKLDLLRGVTFGFNKPEQLSPGNKGLWLPRCWPPETIGYSIVRFFCDDQYQGVFLRRGDKKEAEFFDTETGQYAAAECAAECKLANQEAE